MNTETVTVHQKGEDFDILVQHDQTGSAYGITLSKNAYEQLHQHFVSGSLPSDSLSLAELKNLLCNVSQLIQGWNATEAEWTEWDKEVQSKVHELQNKIDGLSVVNFH